MEQPSPIKYFKTIDRDSPHKLIQLYVIVDLGKLSSYEVWRRKEDAAILCYKNGIPDPIELRPWNTTPDSWEITSELEMQKELGLKLSDIIGIAMDTDQGSYYDF